MLRLTKAWLALIVEQPHGSNAGERVEAVQRWCGGKKGDSWCAELVYFIGSIVCALLGKEWPLPRTASCEELRKFAEEKGILHATEVQGDVYVLLDANGRAHHTGWVIEPGPLSFVERSGNTSDPSQPPSREGLGFYEHTRKHDPKLYRFISWKDLL